MMLIECFNGGGVILARVNKQSASAAPLPHGDDDHGDDDDNDNVWKRHKYEKSYFFKLLLLLLC